LLAASLDFYNAEELLASIDSLDLNISHHQSLVQQAILRFFVRSKYKIENTIDGAENLL